MNVSRIVVSHYNIGQFFKNKNKSTTDFDTLTEPYAHVIDQFVTFLLSAARQNVARLKACC